MGGTFDDEEWMGVCLCDALACAGLAYLFRLGSREGDRWDAKEAREAKERVEALEAEARELGGRGRAKQAVHDK